MVNIKKVQLQNKEMYFCAIVKIEQKKVSKKIQGFLYFPPVHGKSAARRLHAENIQGHMRAFSRLEDAPINWRRVLFPYSSSSGKTDWPPVKGSLYELKNFLKKVRGSVFAIGRHGRRNSGKNMARTSVDFQERAEANVRNGGIARSLFLSFQADYAASV